MYKERVSGRRTGVISSNQGWTHVEMSVRFKFLLDFPCIVMTEAKLPTVIREFRQLNYSKCLDLPFFTATPVEAVHSHARCSIWTCLLEKLCILRMSSLSGAGRHIHTHTHTHTHTHVHTAIFRKDNQQVPTV